MDSHAKRYICRTVSILCIAVAFYGYFSMSPKLMFSAVVVGIAADLASRHYNKIGRTGQIAVEVETLSKLHKH